MADRNFTFIGNPNWQQADVSSEDGQETFTFQTGVIYSEDDLPKGVVKAIEADDFEERTGVTIEVGAAKTVERKANEARQAAAGEDQED